MGRTKNTTDRVEGNMKPSSSSRAAQLLSSSQFSNPNLALGFNSFTSSANSSNFDLTNEDYSKVSSNIEVILKKLTKRNSTTKLKALDELFVEIKSSQTDALTDLFPVWSNFYTKLSADLERRVRVITNQILAFIVDKVGKGIAPHLKLVIAPWLASFYDPSKEVVEIAKKSFDQLFPKDKVQNVIKFGQSTMLTYIQDHLIHHTKDTYSDSRFYTSGEMEKRYARMVECCLNLFGHLLEQLSSELRAPNQKEYDEILDNPKFLQFFTHTDSTIRQAAYYQIRVLALKAPELIEARAQGFGSQFLYKSFSEKDLTCHHTLFPAIVLSTKVVPDMWNYGKKPIINKLVSFVKESCYGSAAAFYPNLPLIIRYLPAPTLTSKVIKGLDAALRTNFAEVSSELKAQTRLEIALMLLDRLDDLTANDSEDRIEILKGLVIPGEYQVTDSELIKLTDRRVFVSFLANLIGVVQQRQDETRLKALLEQLNSRFETMVDINENNPELVANIFMDLISYIQKAKDNSKFNSEDLVLNMIIKLFESSRVLCQDSVATKKFNQHVTNRFCFLCYLSQYINPNSSSKLQEPINNFLDQQLLTLMISFDVSLGLQTLQKFWSSQKSDYCTATQSQATMTKLINLADQPTTTVAYPAKRDLAAIIFNMAREGGCEDSLDSLLTWTLNTVTNLIVTPELNPVPGLKVDPVDNLVKLFVNALRLPIEIIGNDWVDQFVKALQNPVNKFRSIIMDNNLQSTDHLVKLASAVRVVYRTVTLTLSNQVSRVYTTFVVDSDLLCSLVDLSTLNYNKLTAPVQTAWHRTSYDANQLLKIWIENLDSFDASVSLELCSQLVSHQFQSNRVPPIEYIVKVREGLQKVTTVDKILEVILPAQTLWNEPLKTIFNSLPESFRSMASVHRGIFLGYLDRKQSNLAFQSGQYSPIDLTHLGTLDRLTEYTLTLLASDQSDSAVELKTFENTAVANVLQVAVLRGLLKLNQNLDLNDTVDIPLHVLLDVDSTFYDLLKRYKSEDALYQLIESLSKSNNDLMELSYVTLQLIWSSWLQIYPATESIAQRAIDFAKINTTGGYLLLEVLVDRYSDESNSILCFRDQLVDKIWLADFDDLIDSDLTQSLLTQTSSLFTDIYHFDALSRLLLSNSQLQRLASWSAEALERYTEPSVTTLKVWELVLPILQLSVPHLDQTSNLDLVYSTILAILVESSTEYVSYRLKAYALSLVLTLHQLVNLPTFDFVWKKYKSKLTKTVVNLLLTEAELNDELEIELTKKVFLDKLAEVVVELINASDVNTFVHSSKYLYRLMRSTHFALSQAIAHILRYKLVDKARLVDPSSKKAANLPTQLFELLSQDVDDSLSSKLNYLLAWDLAIEYAAAVNHTVKAQLITRIKATDLTYLLFEHLLTAMQIHDSRTFDLAKWEIQQIYFPHLEFSELGAALLASHIYRKLLETTPALARNWWVQLSNRKTISDCESFTSRYFTPNILNSILESVSTDAPNNLDDTQFSVKCNRNELNVKFMNDGEVIELLLLLPVAYPLNPIEVVGRKHLGIHDKKWRQWLLNCNATLQAPDGNVYEALSLWKRNLKLHFEGVADCAICYAVVGTHNKELPNKTCNTCKNRFHASCLFQWFQTSAQSTCPLCRNLF